MFIEVLTQIIILMILILVGFTLGKIKILCDRSVSVITEIILWVVTPCVIIKSFVRKFDWAQLKSFLIIVVATLAMHLVYILISRLCFRKGKVETLRVLQAGAIFSNCGYMALPLQQSLLGDDGVFYCSAFVAIFNLITWSYGIYLMSGDKKYITAKKLVLNPGMIGIVIGLVIFLLSIPVPKVIYEPVAHFAALNTPLPMLVIGYYLSKSDVSQVVKNHKAWVSTALRLIIFPLLTVGGLWAIGLRGSVLVSLAISSSAPIATITTMFSSKFKDDTELSAGLVSLSTILSLITMPPIITLAQMIS